MSTFFKVCFYITVNEKDMKPIYEIVIIIGCALVSVGVIVVGIGLLFLTLKGFKLK